MLDPHSFSPFRFVSFQETDCKPHKRDNFKLNILFAEVPSDIDHICGLSRSLKVCFSLN